MQDTILLTLSNNRVQSFKWNYLIVKRKKNSKSTQKSNILNEILHFLKIYIDWTL